MIAKQLKFEHSYGEKSPHLDSVQWCEAKAILEAIKNTPDNATAHIHTDSKGTVQGLKALIASTSGKIKRLKHKDILSQIVEEIIIGQKMVFIEWVKGHENMSWENHNWISKLKMLGNEWADIEAKKALTKEAENKEDTDCYDKYSLFVGNTVKK